MDNCALVFKLFYTFDFLFFFSMCTNETNIGFLKIFNHIMEKKIFIKNITF